MGLYFLVKRLLILPSLQGVSTFFIHFIFMFCPEETRLKEGQEEMANHNVNEAQFVTFMTEIDSQGQSLHFSHTGQILFLEIAQPCMNMISILLVTMGIMWSKMCWISYIVLPRLQEYSHLLATIVSEMFTITYLVFASLREPFWSGLLYFHKDIIQQLVVSLFLLSTDWEPLI